MLEINKVHCWDCLELMKQIPDKSVDLVITDPPYEFISKNPQGWGFMKKENKKHLDELNESFGMSFKPEKFLTLIKQKLKVFNAYIFTNKSLLLEYIQFAEKNKYKRELMLWLKDNPVPIFNWHYLIDKEYIVYIKEQWATFNSKLWYDNYFTYMRHPIGEREFEHPTVKPKDIIKKIMLISSKDWDIVLDPFLWSWTTAVACKELGRNFIGIEKEQKYVDIANQRLNQTSVSLF